MKRVCALFGSPIVGANVTILVALFLGAGADASMTTAADRSQLFLGSARLERLDAYGSWEPSQLKGRRSVWIFFQPDCHHCEAQFRDLACLSEDVSTLAVGTRARRDRLAAEVRKFKFRGVSVMASPKIEQALKLTATPTTLVLDQEGEILQQFVGRIPCAELQAAFSKRDAKKGPR